MFAEIQILQNQITLEQVLNLLPLFLTVYFYFQIYAQKSLNKNSKRILILLLAQFFIVFLIAVFASFSWKIAQRIMLPFMIPIFLAIPPTCYLYLKSLTTERFFLDKKSRVHFLPALIFFGLFVLLSFPLLTKISRGYPQLNAFLVTILIFLVYAGGIFGGIIQFVFYSVLGFKQYKAHQVKIKNNFSDIENIKLKWMKGFLIVYLIFLLVNLIFNLFPAFDKIFTNVVQMFTSTVFIIYTGYYSVKQIDIYASSLHIPNVEKEQIEQSPISFPEEPQCDLSETNNDIKDIPAPSETIIPKNADTFYSNIERQNELKQEILKLIIDEKKYLNMTLALDDIARELQINKKYISFVINSMMNTNFYNLVNEYRVLEAKKILSGKEGNQFTLEGVGNMVGFKSRSTFITAFKKYTGKTPSDFKHTSLN